MDKTHGTLLLILIIPLITTLLMGCQESQRDIEIIYLRYAYEDRNYYRKIDLKNKEYWKSGPG